MWSILLFRREINRVNKWWQCDHCSGPDSERSYRIQNIIIWIKGRRLKWFYSVFIFEDEISSKTYEEIVTALSLKCGYIHWVPLTTSSVTTITRLQRTVFFASKYFTACNVKKFGYNEHPLTTSGRDIVARDRKISYEGSNQATVYLHLKNHKTSKS